MLKNCFIYKNALKIFTFSLLHTKNALNMPSKFYFITRKIIEKKVLPENSLTQFPSI